MTTVLVAGADSQLACCIKDVSMEFSDLKFIYKNSKELDVTKSSSIEKSFKNQQIDYCINCAAYTNVDKAELEPEIAKAINTNGPKNLAFICKKNDTILIHISTDFVFDGESKVPYKETDKTNPLNVYGLTKRDGENEIKKHWDKHFIIRTSWLYSEYGHNFLKTIIKLSKEKDEISIVNDQIGSPTYAKDLAFIILNFVNEKKEAFGVYHFSNSGSISWFDFAIKIKEIWNLNLKINVITSLEYITDAKRPVYSVLRISKIFNKFKALNWKNSLNQCFRNFN